MKLDDWKKLDVVEKDGKYHVRINDLMQFEITNAEDMWDVLIIVAEDMISNMNGRLYPDPKQLNIFNE